MITYKTIITIVLLLVIAAIPATTFGDSLVAHWKLDESAGSTAADSSVNNNTGTLYNMNDSDWVAGKFGNALDFDGSDDYVQVADHSSIEFGTGSFSISFWIKKGSFSGDSEILINGSSGGGGETGNRYEITNTNSYNDGDGTPPVGAIVFVIDNDAAGNKKVLTSNTTFVTGEWVHCVCIRDASVPRLYIYKNSVLDDDKPGHALNIDSSGEPLYFAQDENYGQRFQGQLDDIRFYDYVLLQNEIDVLYRIDVNVAWEPDPVDEAWNISTTPTLSWSSGNSATSHDVYFGTSEAAVTAAGRLLADINGDGPVDFFDVSVISEQWLTSPAGADPSADLDGNGDVNFADFVLVAEDWFQPGDPVFKGNQTRANNTYNPSTLAENTYYWRIDEVNNTEPNSPYTGNIWSFTTYTAINIDTSGEDIVLDCPGVFKLRFDKSDGGNITEYYDLVHDASASINIAAHMGSLYDGLYMILFKQEEPEQWTANFLGAAGSLEVIDAQPDKVKIRVQGDFVPRNGWTPPASYDIRYTVTSSAQIYIHSRVIFNQAYSNHMQIRQALCLTTDYATSDGWVEFSEDQDLTPWYYENGYDDDYIGARIDATNTKIDPVLIMYTDWDICDYILLIAPPKPYTECLIAWVSSRSHSFAAGEVIEKKFLLTMDQFNIISPSGPASIAAQYRAGDGGDF